MKRNVRLIALLWSCALASCGGQNSGALPYTGDPAHAAQASGNNRKSGKLFATLTISIPSAGSDARRSRRRGRYVSPATQSIQVVVSAASGPIKTITADLTPALNSKCKATVTFGVRCVLTIPLPKGGYTAAISTYDGPLASRRPTGNELSTNEDVPFKVRPQRTNSINLTLGGVPTSVAFIPASSSQLTGSVASGFALPKCHTTAQPVSVFGVDADGNFILGAGAPAVSLRSGSASLRVVSPQQKAPNLFLLQPPTPPTYPLGGSVTYVQAQANPRSSTGSEPVFVIAKVTFTTDVCGVFTEFPIPTASSKPWNIAAGSDGALWFTEQNASKIARIPTTATAANPSITEFSLPTANAKPYGIASDSGGAIWFTESGAAQIGRMLTSGPPIQEFALPHPSSPRGIVAGTDGAMWFADWCANAIERITTSGLLAIHEYPVPTANSGPSGMVLGSDGALWFTETLGNKIGRIPISGAPITESPIGTAHAQPVSIAAGSDAVWFGETCNGNSCFGNFGRLSELAGSSVQETAPPVPSTTLWGVAAGPDGAMWFTQPYNDILYRVTTDGVVSSFPLPNSGSGPWHLTTGPDGNIWFTELFSNKIGRLQ